MVRYQDSQMADIGGRRTKNDSVRLTLGHHKQQHEEYEKFENIQDLPIRNSKHTWSCLMEVVELFYLRPMITFFLVFLSQSLTL